MRKILSTFLTVAFIVSCLSITAQSKKESVGYYQITIYNFSSSEQQSLIDSYLQTAYLPALHKQKINNIGVFTPITNDTAGNKQLYIIIPVKSAEAVVSLTKKINNDEQYLLNGKAYLEAVYNNPPYKRMENILLQQFPMAPYFNLPQLKSAKAERIYELRSYESATEKIFINKVYMFNEGGEIALFKKLGFNAVFYASVIAGSQMPNLMYMTSFENREAREAHWKTFSGSEDWKKLSSMPMYQNNVSKATIILMKATNYSDY